VIEVRSQRDDDEHRGTQQRDRQPYARPRSHRATSSRRLGGQQRDAEDDVDRRAGNEQPLEAKERKEHETGKAGADDRAERVDAVDLSDRALSNAGADEHARDERQRHSRAKRRGQHDGQAQRVSPNREQRVPLRRSRECRHERHHPIE
jgi:hypothetical protein